MAASPYAYPYDVNTVFTFAETELDKAWHLYTIVFKIVSISLNA